MSNPDPFPQFIPNRVAAALRRLEDRIWIERRPIAVEATAATREHGTLAEARRRPRQALKPGSVWGKLYDQRWCRLAWRPSVSPAANGQYLEWNDQGEATLHVDGVPFYGFDVAHRRVAIPPRARELWVESICCQTAIWHPAATGLSAAGSVWAGANLVRRDDAAWAVYHDLKCLFDVLMHWRSRQLPAPPAELPRFGQQPTLEKAPPAYRQLLRWLSRAVDALDEKGVVPMQTVLKDAYHDLREPRPRAQAILAGHAHIDLVWLWPERVGEAKAVHTFATVDRLMSLYPEFQFTYSQPASYRAVNRRAPELGQRVQRRVREQRWEPTGVMDVEGDTLMPCGEALARNLLLGQEEFRALRGSPAQVLWLPDVFGYAGCLPQLMRLADIPWFFTTKLAWSAVTRFPYSSFRWRGTDGSEVLAHVTQDAGYNNRVDLGELHAHAAGHAQADVHPDFLHPTGFGDGGGGPTEEMCERARRLDALLDTPALKWGQPEEFFRSLEPHRDELPVYQGECYLEYHRGTFTTHGELKAAYRQLERALQTREAVAAARGEAPDLTATWRRLVFAQFHDYLPGSSVADVYVEGIPELRRLAAAEIAAARAALSRGRNREEQFFNPVPLRWEGVVRTARGRAAWVALPPLGSAAPAESPPACPPKVTIAARRIGNGIVAAEIGADGYLAALRIAGHDVRLQGPAAVPVLYPDLVANYDAWDVDRHSLDLGQRVDTAVTFGAECDPTGLTAAIVARRRLGRASELVVRYVLHAGESVLRIEAEVDWREEQTWLKLHFPTAYRGSMARFGAPFGSVLRRQQSGPLATEAQWEVPGSRWATVAADGEREGLMLLSEAKYGFSARDGDLTVSLLRSARITGTDDHRYAAPPQLSRLVLPTPFSDRGQHRIRLAVGSYDLGAPREEQPAALAETLFTSPVAFRGAPLSAGLRGLVGGESLIPSWAVPVSATEWRLRLHEVAGQHGVACLELERGWSARPCTLDGRPIPGSTPTNEISFRPYEILTVQLIRP